MPAPAQVPTGGRAGSPRRIVSLPRSTRDLTDRQADDRASGLSAFAADCASGLRARRAFLRKMGLLKPGIVVRVARPVMILLTVRSLKTLAGLRINTNEKEASEGREDASERQCRPTCLR